MSAREKIAYLRGLLDGGRPADEAQARVMAALVEALDALASELEGTRSRMDEQAEEIRDLSDALDELEDDLARQDEAEDLDEAEEDEDYVLVRCPHCSKEFFYDPDEYEEDEQLLCPRCGEPFRQPRGGEE